MPEGEASAGRLFISYSRKNKAEVYPFADALAQAGIDVWIDKEGISATVSPARTRCSPGTRRNTPNRATVRRNSPPLGSAPGG